MSEPGADGPRYVPSVEAYAEPCSWCGSEVLLFNGAAVYELDGFPAVHICPAPRHVPNEREFADTVDASPDDDTETPATPPVRPRATSAPPARRMVNLR